MGFSIFEGQEKEHSKVTAFQQQKISFDIKAKVTNGLLCEKFFFITKVYNKRHHCGPPAE
jgi:hypothetical protein